jgi:UDP-N-acetylglucosamine--N-acetylmuramyl-(pentapeptide) pyrophosphoryl-undecaprenol N-acetylglucosamine transferase
MSFGFRRLLERLVDVLPKDADVVWQTGCTDSQGLGIDPQPWMGANELQTQMAVADVVVAHAGVGSALAALQAGAFPILVPRRAQHSEHVDDHQGQVAEALAVRQLAQQAEPEQITDALLADVAGRAVRRRTTDVAPIVLGRCPLSTESS